MVSSKKTLQLLFGMVVRRGPKWDLSSVDLPRFFFPPLPLDKNILMVTTKGGVEFIEE